MAPHETVKIPNYRLRLDVVKAFLKEKYGQDARIVVKVRNLPAPALGEVLDIIADHVVRTAGSL